MTNRLEGSDGNKGERLLVFIPGSPNPTLGRMVVLDPGSVETSDMTVNEALKSLLSAGTTPLPGSHRP